jgi:hypothetical protein
MAGPHPWGERYESAIQALQKHVHRLPNGTYELDVDNARDAGIDDPVIFADLKRSLEETNKKILNHELEAL